MFRSALISLCLFSSVSYSYAEDNSSVYAVNSVYQETRTETTKKVKSHIPHSSSAHEVVRSAARKHGVPEHIAYGVIMVESKYNCNAYNPSGASGIGQMLPQTFRAYSSGGSIYSCASNADASMKYLAEALRKGGTGCAGISLYERGVYAQPVCTSYGRKVLQYASR